MEVVVDVSRIVLSLYFLYNGFNHVKNHPAVTEYASSKGVPAPGFMVGLTGLMLLAGGASYLFEYEVAAGSWLLAVFLVPTAIKMHAFWTAQDAGQKANELAHFLKNIALAAAVLMIAGLS